MMTTFKTKKAAELAARLEAIEAERAAHEQRLADALEHAGAARVALVEDLLELLEIEPEPVQPQRNKRTGEVLRDRSGAVKMMNPDPDETVRMQRLADRLEAVFRRVETMVPAVTDAPVEDGESELDAGNPTELMQAG